MIDTLNFIKNNYGTFYFDLEFFQRLFELMQHDKKNESSQVNFSLLSNIGEVHINQTITREEIFESFNFLLDFLI